MLTVRDDACRDNARAMVRLAGGSRGHGTTPSTAATTTTTNDDRRRATGGRALKIRMLLADGSFRGGSASRTRKGNRDKAADDDDDDPASRQRASIADARAAEMRELNQQLCRRIRRVDERQVNRLLRQAPNLNLGRLLFRRELPQPNKARRAVKLPLPNTLRSLVRELGLLDEPDRRTRVRLFVARCLALGYAYRTANRYYLLLRRVGVFDNPRTGQPVALRPDKFAFADSGRMHVRPVSKRSFAKLVTHLHRNFSEYTAPLLVAVYTGLRTFEILQWNTSTLRELRDKQTIVAIIRKQTVVRDASAAVTAYGAADRDNAEDGEDDDGLVFCGDEEAAASTVVGNGHGGAVANELDAGEGGPVDGGDRSSDQLAAATIVRNADSYWRPVYSTRLLWFVDRMIELYRDEYEQYERTGLAVMLFHVGPSTLVNRMRNAFYEANGYMPPYGFGIHSCRNMLAEIMSERTDSLTSIQAFLQHRKMSVTRRYVHADFNYVRDEYDRLTKHELANAKALLRPPPATARRSDDCRGSDCDNEESREAVEPVDLQRVSRPSDAQEANRVTRVVNEAHEERTRWLLHGTKRGESCPATTK